MRRWNTPQVNIIHGLLFLLSAGLGVLHLYYHHRPWHLVAINFTAAGVILGLNIYCALLRRRVEAQIREIRARRQPMSNDEVVAYKKANANLERVAKNLGAQLYACEHATISIRGDHFAIAPLQISRTRKSGEWQRTCLRQPPMPGPEMIAATLLLLHNDPTIFERWCRQDGWYS